MKDCTIKVYLSADEKRAIKARMQQLGFKTSSEYLRYVLKVNEIKQSKEAAAGGSINEPV